MDSHRPSLIVTGSTGRIGAALLQRFKGKFNLIGFDRESSPHPPPFAECVCVDFGSDKSVELVLERVREGYGKRIASVIHLAAYYDLSGEWNPKYQEVTVRGTERLLKGLQEFEVEQFIPCWSTPLASRAAASTKSRRWSRSGRIRSRRPKPSN